MDKTKIIVVFKTHFDIGFTALAEEIVAKYSEEMLDAVLNVCEGTADNEAGKRYVWTMSSWPLLQSLQNASPERRARAEKLIEGGQLLAHALPYTTHTEFMGFEELCREFSFSRALCDRYGLPYPVSAKMTDVPGHTWFLPSLLAQAGVKFLHIGCNSACMPPDVPLLFWWEGPDGARVLTMYNTTYGSGLFPPKNWKYPVWLALLQTNDNIGPQSCGIVGELQKQIEESGIDADFEIATMDKFYEEISHCDLAGLPVVKADLADTWIHGVGTYPAEVSRLRRLRGALTVVEAYAALARKSESSVREKLAEAYEEAELFGEHTWGLDVKSTLGYDRKYKKSEFIDWRRGAAPLRMEESWNEQRRRVYRVEELLKEIESNVSKGERPAYFNPLGRPFEGYVETSESVGGAFESCGKNYVRLCVPAASCLDAEKAVLSAEAPMVIEDTDRIFLQNENIRISVGKKDGTFMFTWLPTGKVWLSSAPRYEYNVIGSNRINRFIRNYSSRFYDWSVNDLGRMAYPEETAEEHFYARVACVERAGQGIRILYKLREERSVKEFGNAESIVVEYTLLGDRLHITLRLSGKQATPYVESGIFCLPFNAEQPRFLINKVGSCIDPAEDIATAANHRMYCLENWADLSDGEEGITIVSRDAPLFSLGEDGTYKFNCKYSKPRSSALCFNLFNNSWGTNFPQWIEGDLEYEFDLLPHAGKNAAKETAYAIVYAPRLMYCVDTFSDCLSVEGAELSSVCDEGDCYIVRVRETAGTGSVVTVSGKIPDESSSVEKIDLYGRVLEWLPFDKVRLNLPAFGFATLRFLKTEEYRKKRLQ